jgi:hypothetical protein
MWEDALTQKIHLNPFRTSVYPGKHESVPTNAGLKRRLIADSIPMPPESDGLRTVGCSLERLITNGEHLQKIRCAVSTVLKGL